MADENANQAAGTEEHGKQTVTAEQFEELKKNLEETQRALEETKKAQSGSDRRVKELTEQLTAAKKQTEDAEKTAEQKLAERMAALEKQAEESDKKAKLAQQKALAIDLLGKEGLKAPKYLDRLIGGTDEETQALISDYIEDKKATKAETADEYAKKHGRKVTDSNTGDVLLSYEELQEKSKDPEWVEKNEDLINKSLEAMRG